MTTTESDELGMEYDLFDPSWRESAYECCERLLQGLSLLSARKVIAAGQAG